MRVQGLLRWLCRPGGGSAPPATILVRLAVGGVFFASGLIKFLYANQGAGRFAKLGIPAPELTASFVGVVEIAAGILRAVGLATRLAAIPLVIDMLVAIGTSKLPMLFGAGPEPVAAAPKVGLWAFVYQARLDSAMLLGCLFLIAVGAGAWSLDAWYANRARKSSKRDKAAVHGDLFEAVTAAPNGRSRSTRARAQDQTAQLHNCCHHVMTR
jgi:putative oxidoreductase